MYTMTEDMLEQLHLTLKGLAHGPPFAPPGLTVEEIVVDHLAPCTTLQTVRGRNLLDLVQVHVEGDVAYTKLG